MKEKNEDGSYSYEGYCIDLLNELARNLKFTYEIYVSPDGMYGAETKNGTWNGMIGEIVNEVWSVNACNRGYLTSPIIQEYFFQEIED